MVLAGRRLDSQNDVGTALAAEHCRAHAYSHIRSATFCLLPAGTVFAAGDAGNPSWNSNFFKQSFPPRASLSRVLPHGTVRADLGAAGPTTDEFNRNTRSVRVPRMASKPCTTCCLLARPAARSKRTGTCGSVDGVSDHLAIIAPGVRRRSRPPRPGPGGRRHRNTVFDPLHGVSRPNSF